LYSEICAVASIYEDDALRAQATIINQIVFNSRGICQRLATSGILPSSVFPFIDDDRRLRVRSRLQSNAEIIEARAQVLTIYIAELIKGRAFRDSRKPIATRHQH